MRPIKRLLVLKNTAVFLATSYSIALTTVSLINLSGKLPNVEIKHSDKFFHFIAYSLLCLLWYIVFSFKKEYSKKKSIFHAVLLSILFGIIIEVLQGTVTTHRSSDVYDAIANSLGALLMGSLLWITSKIQVKNK